MRPSVAWASRWAPLSWCRWRHQARVGGLEPTAGNNNDRPWTQGVQGLKVHLKQGYTTTYVPSGQRARPCTVQARCTAAACAWTRAAAAISSAGLLVVLQERTSTHAYDISHRPAGSAHPSAGHYKPCVWCGAKLGGRGPQRRHAALVCGGASGAGGAASALHPCQRWRWCAHCVTRGAIRRRHVSSATRPPRRKGFKTLSQRGRCAGRAPSPSFCPCTGSRCT